MSTIDEANVISLIIEAVLYVVYLVTLAYGLRCLVYDDEGQSVRKKINWLMLAVIILTFVLMTLSLAMDVDTLIVLRPTMLTPIPDISGSADIGLTNSTIVRLLETYSANLD